MRKHGGKGNIFENFGSDIASMVLGTPAFFKRAYEDVGRDVAAQPWSLAMGPAAPIWAIAAQRGKSRVYKNVAKPMAADYAYRWGPLFRGDIPLAAGRFAEHPGFGLLDIATVASLGTGGAVKAGLAKPAPRAVKLALPSGEKVSRAVVGGELSRRLRVGAQEALNRLPKEAYLGEYRRAGKVQKRQNVRAHLSREARLEPYQAAEFKLTRKQRVALSLRAEYATTARVKREVERLRKLGTPEALAQAKLYSDPKILRWVDQPTHKMMRVFDSEDFWVTPLREEQFERGGLLGKEAAEQRRWQPLLLQEGARMVPEPEALMKLADSLGMALDKVPESFVRDLPHILEPPPGKTIPQMVEAIRATLPEGFEPRYRPQKMQADEHGGSGYGSGGTVPQRSPIRQNRAQLWAAGKIARSIDTLGPNTQKLLRWSLYTDKYEQLIRGAKPLAGEAVDGKAWRYVKRHRNERIGYMERNQAAFEVELERLVDLEDPGVSALGKELTTDLAEEAATDAMGRRLIVPGHYAKQVIGDFARNDAIYARIYRDVTQVWRALVLNLRVGWLVNNLVGNTFLFTVKSAGIGGLRAYWQEVLRSPGGQAKAHAMISDPALRRQFSPEFWAEHFGDQVLGTFYGTQTPETGRVAALLGAKWSPTRALRSLDVGYEKRMRKAQASVYMKRNPAMRRFYQEMPEQQRSWEAAARKGFEDDPLLAERISQQVSDALGDFVNMSDFERKVLRGAAPFYGWYRAITLIMVKMPLDSPGRTLILANMSKVGMEWSDDYGLPWLEGAIPFGGNRVLGSQAMNPYSTPYSLGRGAFGGDWYAARQREGFLNPILPAAVRAFGQPRTFWEPFYEEGRSLPEVRLAFPQQRASYSGSDWLRELYGYLGVPLRELSPETRKRKP